MTTVIGVTGGIGTGKSTVSQMLRELGAYVFDADRVGHELLAAPTEAQREVIAAFGKDILNHDGSVDRSKLGAIVFADRKALERLNAIMHPRMFQTMKERIDVLRRNGVGVVVLEAAILLEAGWAPLVDQLWVTSAPEATVVQRLRDRWNEEQVRARMASQMDPKEKAGRAQVVIDTDCSLEEVRARVKKAWQRLTPGGFRGLRSPDVTVSGGAA